MNQPVQQTHLSKSRKLTAVNGQASPNAKVNIKPLHPTYTDNLSVTQRLQFIQKLQSSLEIDTLIQQLFNTINGLIELDGLTYLHKEYDLTIHCGKTKHHSCSYRIITETDQLGEIIGYRQQRFTEEELTCLEDLLQYVVCPLRNALQYRSAIQAALYDPLTGAGNRIALDNALHRELQVCKREKQPLSLLVLDLDYFKQINDSYGHSAGDYVLKQTVACLHNSLRNVDMVFRYGGEEFIVLLSKTSKKAAAVVAERLRKSIEDMQCQYNNIAIPLTASLGTSTLEAKDTIQDLFNRADQALYRAKASGRNVVISS
ncbi:GGDEF domain-containing protein [Zooshikella marina]|uniref:diguanylate cyclase n=1 Tax=Zooshikella ganghwensis TaxID=202772 RepID=A0A4P9VKT3_9GAMM|nr:GGDEF domain-containing protein [Zooshikella ganghwensis]MBU2704640.1 GGDEF domain-containing protein [Zooshikella ganghwensis]RDH43139.1 GGDEF domain-containing protein [Zooshikella ganghwensis]